MNKISLAALGVVIVSGVVLLPKLFRQDTSLPGTPVKNEISIGTDVCAEFPQDFIATALGKAIIKTEANNSAITNVCRYYTDETNFVTLRLNNLSVDNQKKGQETLGRTITTNDQIKMEHFIVLQDDGVINGAYLVINPNLFIAVDRTSATAANETEIIAFAAKVANRLQNGAGAETEQADVPLPQQEDIVRNFFNLISEGKIPEAVEMMSQGQAWSDQLNAFQSITLKQIEPAGDNNYQVTLDVEMKPEAANGPIPYYGYENGVNIRWIGLIKVGGLWKITGIATGP